GEPVDWGPTLLATGIAFVVGLAVIVYFLRYISTHSFRPFVVYRIALGLVVLGLLAAGVIDT
ncbi:MAG TPA: undecaprenyl-diphosphate phosphatase, partial [Actinomycetes bacterium]|nr:undecaprenyl-diphosphate phosphatase [Actinomycetes bacterium]